MSCNVSSDSLSQLKFKPPPGFYIVCEWNAVLVEKGKLSRPGLPSKAMFPLTNLSDFQVLLNAKQDEDFPLEVFIKEKHLSPSTMLKQFLVFPSSSALDFFKSLNVEHHDELINKFDFISWIGRLQTDKWEQLKKEEEENRNAHTAVVDEKPAMRKSDFFYVTANGSSVSVNHTPVCIQKTDNGGSLGKETEVVTDASEKRVDLALSRHSIVADQTQHPLISLKDQTDLSVISVAEGQTDDKMENLPTACSLTSRAKSTSRLISVEEMESRKKYGIKPNASISVEYFKFLDSNYVYSKNGFLACHPRALLIQADATNLNFGELAKLWCRNVLDGGVSLDAELDDKNIAYVSHLDATRLKLFLLELGVSSNEHFLDNKTLFNLRCVALMSRTWELQLLQFVLDKLKAMKKRGTAHD